MDASGYLVLLVFAFFSLKVGKNDFYQSQISVTHLKERLFPSDFTLRQPLLLFH
jgi:hypothetical protein